MIVCNQHEIVLNSLGSDPQVIFLNAQFFGACAFLEIFGPFHFQATPAISGRVGLKQGCPEIRIRFYCVFVHIEYLRNLAI